MVPATPNPDAERRESLGGVNGRSFEDVQPPLTGVEGTATLASEPKKRRRRLRSPGSPRVLKPVSVKAQ